MNHLLHQFTWHQYLTTALAAAIIYYLFIILRCYQPELKKIRQRLSENGSDDDLQALQYQAPEATIPGSGIPATAAPEKYLQESINETDILSGQLKACIAKAAGKPFAPAILIPQLKQLLHQHHEPATVDRPSINLLVVSECEKTGTAMLTEEEVDQWWER